MHQFHICSVISSVGAQDFHQLKVTAINANTAKKNHAKPKNIQMGWYVYKNRYLAEGIFAKLKSYRQVSTRFNLLGNV
ncbi:hypothetical protein C9426_27605 [Serratia sp. S1B]|nr:hypothetical protein C9426_27605 [Serratia sp. S1B]